MTLLYKVWFCEAFLAAGLYTIPFLYNQANDPWLAVLLFGLHLLVYSGLIEMFDE